VNPVILSKDPEFLDRIYRINRIEEKISRGGVHVASGMSNSGAKEAVDSETDLAYDVINCMMLSATWRQ